MQNFMYAFRPLLSDFLSTIVFVVLTAVLKLDVRTAVLIASGVGVAQVLIQVVRRKPVPLLQWAGLGLVLVFGAASFLTNDPRFVMVKPSIIYVAIGIVMLKPGWMLRYMPPIARGHGDRVMTVFGFVWAGLMLATAAANAVIAIAFTHLWAGFIAVVPTVSKLALFAIQYATVRTVVRRKIIAERALAANAVAP